MNMLISPRPGVNRKTLRDTLESVCAEASNLRGAGPKNAYNRLLDYLKWTSSAVRMLRTQVSGADLNQLVLTRRYELILTGIANMSGVPTEAQSVVNGLVCLELDERVSTFQDVIRFLDDHIEKWTGPGIFVMPDTSFYIHHSQKLEEADFASLLKLEFPNWPIRVLVPMVVVDELDRLKESKDKHVRWRARHTVAVLDRAFEEIVCAVRLRAPEFLSKNPTVLSRGEITIEILPDPPEHARLPIEDDEIIDRALAVEPLAERKVRLITYDTGQATRARMAGLQVVKLAMPIGDGPEE